MRKREHYLSFNRTNKLQCYWLFYDVESTIEQVDEHTQYHHFRLGYAIYVRLEKDGGIRDYIEYVLHSPDDFISVLEKHSVGNKTLHAVAHNCGYDLQILDVLPTLMERGWEIKHLYLKNNVVIIRLTKGKRVIVFEDGLNRIKGKIEDWGKKLGLPKKKVSFTTVSDSDLLDYCKRDTEILAKATLYYLRFVQEHNLGDVKSTISAQALAAYKHRFMRHKIKIHTNKEATELERCAYGGGMVRTFHRGSFSNDIFYQLDVNCMYAYIMKEYEYPTRLLILRSDVGLDFIAKYLDRYCVIAACTVQPRSTPFRCLHLGHITYPLAKFDGVFTTNELRRLLSEDSIIKVHKVAVYHKAPLFSDYVDYFWNIRLQAITSGDKVLKENAKQFLNSLYGKFGARSGGFKRYTELEGTGHKPESILLLGEVKPRTLFWIGEQCYMEELEEEAYDSFVAIAAEITANARLYLYSLVEQAGYENVYYTDTDSIIVNQEGYERLKDRIDNTKLGYLKEEYKADRVTIYARKDYEIGDKIVCKGVNNTFVIEDKRKYSREQWQSIRHYLRTNCREKFRITTTDLCMNRICYDGEVTEDGVVLPFRVLPQRWGY